MSDSICLGPNLWLQDDELIITGYPSEGDDLGEDHNCDVMGCNSVHHVIERVRLQEGWSATVLAEAAKQVLAERKNK